MKNEVNEKSTKLLLMNVLEKLVSSQVGSSVMYKYKQMTLKQSRERKLINVITQKQQYLISRCDILIVITFNNKLILG